MPNPQAEFRCYAELNDFLPPPRRQRAFRHGFFGTPSVKDTIEALGIPHTEVELILVDGKPVDFGHRLRGGERVAVYPMFESLDVTPLVKLRERPLRQSRFVLDVHLGRLARRLRMLGLDALHRNDTGDPELVAIAAREKRILLTRDRALLKHGSVTHGYWLRATRADDQLDEVLNRFDLSSQLAPFTRCMACNGVLEAVAKEAVWAQLPERTRRNHDAFQRCADCGKVYWEGSHYRKMGEMVERLTRPDLTVEGNRR